MVSQPSASLLIGAARRDAEFISSNIEHCVRTGARPHHLVVGPPGAGKTHVLRAVQEHLHEHCGPAGLLVLTLSDFGVGSYADLLVEALRRCEPGLADQARRVRAQQTLIGSLVHTELEELVRTAAAGRPVVLVIEQLDRIFTSINQGGQGSFRAWVETSCEIMVLASTTTLPKPLASRSWPWFGSFNLTRLAPFTRDDVAELLAARAGNALSPASIDATYTRVGGSPRVWQSVVDVIKADGRDDPAQIVPAVLDRLSPYLLPPLQSLASVPARLIVALARSAERAMTVTALADEIGVSNQNAAAALGRLTAIDWVRRTKPDDSADRRQTFYAIADPLMREFIRSRDSSAATLLAG